MAKTPQPDPMMDLPFPLKGLNEDTSISALPSGTSASLQNVRSYDQRTGRNRGAQRPGLDKYCPDSFGGSLQDINHLTVNSGAQGGYGFGTGRAYIWGSGAFAAINHNGTYANDGPNGGLENYNATFDQDGNLYVSYGTVVGSSGLLSVRKYGVDNTELIWTWTYQDTPGTVQPEGIVLSEGILYLLAALYNTGTSQNSHIFRINAATGASIDAAPPWISSTIGQSYQLSPSNINIAIGKDKIAVAYFDAPAGFPKLRIITKATGVVSSTTTIDGTGFDVSDIAADSSDNFYVAYASTNGGLTNVANTLKAYNSTGVLQWTKTGVRIFSVCYDRLQSTLVAVGAVIGTAATFLVQFKPSDGTELTSAAPYGHAWNCIRPDGRMGYGLAHTNGDFAYISSAFAAQITINVPLNFGYEMACCSGQETSYASATGGRRVIRGVAVAGGTVACYDTVGKIPVTSGTTALSSLRPVVFSAPNGGFLYFADGVSQKKYDPVANAVLAWTPTAGSMPVDSQGNYPTLLTTWRGRTVVSGLIADPQNIFFSRQNDPTDWDYGATPVDPQMAVALNNALAGQPSDTVNTLISYSDDVLIIGCDHTIWKMTGDPADGGRLDQLCDSIGMAWGQPWTRDSKGGIYFASTQGSIYYLQPGSKPQKVTQTIDTRFLAINQGKNIFRLAWDDRWQGLHVFVTPLDVPTASTHYYFDAINQAWFIDVYANTNHDPKTVHLFDGDAPDDRSLLFGSWDGYIRRSLPENDDDDGTAIDSFVLMGPLQMKGRPAFLLKELQCVLAAGSGKIGWGVQVGESAESALLGGVVEAGVFNSGRSRSQLIRRRGHAAFVKLSANGVYWSLESLMLSMKVLPGAAERIF